MQRKWGMVCELCGKENPKKYQDFCADLGCSGLMVISKQEKKMKLKDLEAEALKEIQAEEAEGRKKDIQRLYKEVRAAKKVLDTLTRKYELLLDEEV